MTSGRKTLEQQLMNLMHFVIRRNKYSKLPSGYESTLCPSLNKQLAETLFLIGNEHFSATKSTTFTKRIYSLMKHKDIEEPVVADILSQSSETLGMPVCNESGETWFLGVLKVNAGVLRRLLLEFTKDSIIVETVFEILSTELTLNKKGSTGIPSKVLLLHTLVDYFALYYFVIQCKFNGITGMFFPPVTVSMLYLIVEMICNLPDFVEFYEAFKLTWPKKFAFNYFNNAFVQVGLCGSTEAERQSNLEYASLVRQSTILEYLNPAKNPVNDHFLNIQLYKDKVIKWILGEGPFSAQMLTNPNLISQLGIREGELSHIVGNPDESILAGISNEKLVTLGFRKKSNYQYAGESYYAEILQDIGSTPGE